MKYTHPNHPHVYYISKGIYGYRVKQYSKDDGIPGSSIELNDEQYPAFKSMLEKGGWHEQSTSR